MVAQGNGGTGTGGREASPMAGSQSVKTTESGGISGHVAGKKIKCHKRHIIIDTIGLLIGFVIHGADVQDREGAKWVLQSNVSGMPKKSTIRNAMCWCAMRQAG